MLMTFPAYTSIHVRMPMAEIVSFAIESFRQSMSTHKVKKKKKRGVSVEPSFVN